MRFPVIFLAFLAIAALATTAFAQCNGNGRSVQRFEFQSQPQQFEIIQSQPQFQIRAINNGFNRSNSVNFHSGFNRGFNTSVNINRNGFNSVNVNSGFSRSPQVFVRRGLFGGSVVRIR